MTVIINPNPPKFKVGQFIKYTILEEGLTKYCQIESIVRTPQGNRLHGNWVRSINELQSPEYVHKMGSWMFDYGCFLVTPSTILIDKIRTKLGDTNGENINH